MTGREILLDMFTRTNASHSQRLCRIRRPCHTSNCLRDNAPGDQLARNYADRLVYHGICLVAMRPRLVLEAIEDANA